MTSPTKTRLRGAILIALATAGLVGGCAASPSGPAGPAPESSAAASGEVGASASAPAVPVPTESVAPVEPSPVPTAPVAAAPIAGTAVPDSVSIPSIDLDEQLIDLGLQDDGSMEVPADFSRVGWFTGGGRPGGIGPTVIAGHIDSSVGPAVFYRLDELAVGDTFDVRGADGTPFTYRVYEIGNYAKADFPTAPVFGATATDEARLITCSGVFDRSVGHYEDNLVVFAARA